MSVPAEWPHLGAGSIDSLLNIMDEKHNSTLKTTIPCRDRTGSEASSAPPRALPRRKRSNAGLGNTRRDVHQIITDAFLEAVGHAPDVRKSAIIYFKGIRCCLSVVSKSQFYERPPSIFASPKAGQTMLCIVKALINVFAPPENDPVAQDSIDALYNLLKMSIAHVEAADINSLEVVPARLLVTMFEVAQDLSGAYISIAGLARAAAAIGINEMVSAARSPVCEESFRVWWAIAMLDGYGEMNDLKASIPWYGEAQAWCARQEVSGLLCIYLVTEVYGIRRYHLSP
ncbi:hypothetical protein BJ878DRAFT_482305 [Calycina marina]|uniref:Transcription factor domain-containing protein n=1 Tax=Calycina marina TaxID=1763456 RepID=A0A9P7YZJ5_9HELO|nr:hypothetical protein BJ878DRAFT_482305 [Calycina marina]